MVEYASEDLRDYLLEELPDPDGEFDDILVFVMGPYTTTDLTHYFDDIDEEEELPESDFGAFSSKDNMQEILEHVVDILREEIGVNAFIATNANIPYDADDDLADEKPIVNIIAQSKGYARVADIVLFILPYGGIRDGVDIEIGTILEANIDDTDSGGFEFESDTTDDTNVVGRDSADKFHILREEGVKSQTLNSLQEHYGVSMTPFDSQIRLGLQLRIIIKNHINQFE